MNPNFENERKDFFWTIETNEMGRSWTMSEPNEKKIERTHLYMSLLSSKKTPLNMYPVPLILDYTHSS